MKKIHLLTLDLILVMTLVSLSSIGYILVEKNNNNTTDKKQENKSFASGLITDYNRERNDQPPITFIIEPVRSIIETREVTITWRGEDDYTLADDLEYTYYLHGLMNNWSEWVKYTSKKFILNNGEYYFEIKSRDSAGNIQTRSTIYRFTVLNASTLMSKEKKTYSLNWCVNHSTCLNNNSCYTYRWRPWVRTIRVPQENIERIQIKIEWVDDKVSRFFKLGKDKLILIIIKNNTVERYPGAYNSNDEGYIQFTSDTLTNKPEDTIIQAENIEEAYEIASSNNKTTWPNQGFTIKVRCLTGEARLIRKLIDKGNIFSITVNITYYQPCIREMDATPPDTLITYKPGLVTNETRIHFEWTGYDDHTPRNKITYRYRLLGYDNEWSTWSNKTTEYYNVDSPGVYTFIVQAKDEAGNTDPSPAEYTFTVTEVNTDDAPPETIILSAPAGTLHYNNATIRWMGYDDQTPSYNLVYSYKLEPLDNEWSEWSNSTTRVYNNLSDGNYTFSVRAKDTSGNIDSSPAQVLFIIQTQSPEPPCRYATRIIDFNSGEYGGGVFPPENILGGPRGGGVNTGSLHVVVLGRGGSITVGFNVTITNNAGPDFIVFENPFYIGNTPYVFAELVFVEVSTNGVDYARFPCCSTTSQPVPPFGGILPGNITGLAGVHPVLANIDENNINPFNPMEAGGDAFDLSDLIDHPLVSAGLVDLNNINYIRLVDIIGDGSLFDTTGHPIYDALDGNGADIDAVAVINYRV